MDLPLWDEAHYMGEGEMFLHGGTLGHVSGSPVYILLYSLLVKIFGTINSVFYMQYFVKISVSTLLLLFLIDRLQSRLLSLLLALIWVLSYVNVWEGVLVYHVALGFFLIALIFSDTHPILTLLLLILCSLTRLEYLFPTLAYGGYLILTTIMGRRNKPSQPPASAGAITGSRFMTFVLAVLLFFVLLNVDEWNLGNKRTWFAFNQHYARHEVEAGRYALNPYIDSNIVIKNDFPGADSLTEAFLINPGAFSKHLFRNIVSLPKAVITFGLPYTKVRSAFGVLYGVLLGFALTIILYAASNNQRQFFSGALRAAREQKRVLYLTLMSTTALIPGIFSYALPHYTLIMVPFCLLWPGFTCLHTLKIMNSLKFKRWALVTLNSLFILSILMVDKPYASNAGGRPVYEQVTQLIEVWPDGRVKLMGVGAASYGYYIGSRKVHWIEPLATAYGGKVENGGVDLRTLIERHDPDAIIINRSLADSKNFDAASLEVLETEWWLKCPFGSDSIYLEKEKFKRCR